MADLSVILISKNQEWNMHRLIESVLRATSAVARTEIVLVDSMSSDATTEVARRYPITVLRLKPGQIVTPSAGRWVGYHHTTNELVLFLDGDMELVGSWLPLALQIMKDRPDAAVVTGQVVDVPDMSPGDSVVRLAPPRCDSVAREVLHGGGAALYRRSILEQLGTFNPYLYSDEEPELCLRVRQAGYRVLQTQCPISFHYSLPREDIHTVVARWRRNLYLGAGQNLRYKMGTDQFWPYVRERGFGLIPTAGLLAGFAGLALGLARGRWRPIRVWSALVGLLMLFDAVRKRSLYLTLVSLLKRAIIADGTVRGFFFDSPDPDSYPGLVEVIRRQELPAMKHRVEV